MKKRITKAKFKKLRIKKQVCFLLNFVWLNQRKNLKQQMSTLKVYNKS